MYVCVCVRAHVLVGVYASEGVQSSRGYWVLVIVPGAGSLSEGNCPTVWCPGQMSGCNCSCR